MDARNLDKAMELFAKLIVGEPVGETENSDLYEVWRSNAEVYDILDSVLKKSNLNLYEYENALYLSAGEGNRVFGFTNEELKKAWTQEVTMEEACKNAAKVMNETLEEEQQ